MPLFSSRLLFPPRPRLRLRLRLPRAVRRAAPADGVSASARFRAPYRAASRSACQRNARSARHSTGWSIVSSRRWRRGAATPAIVDTSRFCTRSGELRW